MNAPAARSSTGLTAAAAGARGFKEIGAAATHLVQVAKMQKARREDAARHATELATVHSIRQGEALGLGHAILQARTHVGDDDSFVVALGDDIVDPDSDFLSRMIAQHDATGRAHLPGDTIGTGGQLARP